MSPSRSRGRPRSRRRLYRKVTARSEVGGFPDRRLGDPAARRFRARTVTIQVAAGVALREAHFRNSYGRAGLVRWRRSTTPTPLPVVEILGREGQGKEKRDHRRDS